MHLSKVKLAEVVIGNVEKPKSGRIQSASKSPRYGSDGEPVNGSVAKVVCQFVDTDLAHIVEKAGSDASQLKTYTLELIGEEPDLINLSEQELLGSEIQLADAKVMLRWTTGRMSG